MDPVKTAQQWIQLESVTQNSNAAVSQAMQRQLEQLGFSVITLPYVDGNGTSKLSLTAKRDCPKPSQRAGIGFFCHNDVVSVEGWDCPHGGPFEAAIAHDRLWGRGACDMKGPIAAAMAAVAQIPQSDQTAPIYFMITGDEECGMAGARVLADRSEHYAEMVSQRAVGIIGEPTELQVVNAHKGVCHLDVSCSGVAAHSSTRDGLNANWQLIPFLESVRQIAERCDTEAALQNAAFSPPTLSLNLIIENHPCSANITVGKAICRIFFRPMPDTAWESLMQELCDHAGRHKLTVSHLTLPPLYTPAESTFVQTALRLLDQPQPLAVSYATDGCCFDQLSDLIVLGPGSIEQAHRSDEWIALEQLQKGVQIYTKLFRHYACEN